MSLVCKKCGKSEPGTGAHDETICLICGTVIEINSYENALTFDNQKGAQGKFVNEDGTNSGNSHLSKIYINIHIYIGGQRDSKNHRRYILKQQFNQFGHQMSLEQYIIDQAINAYILVQDREFVKGNGI